MRSLPPSVAHSHSQSSATARYSRSRTKHSERHQPVVRPLRKSAPVPVKYRGSPEQKQAVAHRRRGQGKRPVDLEDGEILSDEFSGTGSAESGIPSLVVIDGKDVGRKFGIRRTCIRSQGIIAALNYYLGRGINAVAILPSSSLDSNAPDRDQIDDKYALLPYIQNEKITFTPLGTKDNSFLLNYSMSKQADLVSNQNFQDEIQSQVGGNLVATYCFIRDHLIPYAFCQSDFVPHPDPCRLKTGVHHARLHPEGAFR